MVEVLEKRLHLGLLLLGVLFILVHIAARYYVVLVLLPQGAVTLAMVSLRDNLLRMGITVSAAALVLPSAGFKKDEERIVLYLFALTAIFFTLGLYLNSIESSIAIYLIYNSGVILTVMATVILLGYLGVRGRRILVEETDRIAMAVLALMLVVNVALAVWEFSVLSSGRQVDLNISIFSTHSIWYAVWMVLAAFFMKFSNPSETLYRRIILGLVTITLVWTLTFASYTLGIPIQIVSGVMDVLLGIAILAVLLSLWGLKSKRGQITPHLALGSIALIWFIIAGSVGLYLLGFYSFYQLPVPSEWRLFHLMNANWALMAGLGALGLASAKSSGRVGWIAAILFSAGMIKMIITYLTNIVDANAARPLLLLGEPFIAIAFLIIAYTLFTAGRKGAT